MEWSARIVLDTADIVRDGDFSPLSESRKDAGGIAAAPDEPAAKATPYFLVLTKLTQSPWFVNFRGTVKVFQPPFLH